MCTTGGATTELCLRVTPPQALMTVVGLPLLTVSILRTEEKESKAGIPDCILIVHKRKEKK